MSTAVAGCFRAFHQPPRRPVARPSWLGARGNRASLVSWVARGPAWGGASGGSEPQQPTLADVLEPLDSIGNQLKEVKEGVNSIKEEMKEIKERVTPWYVALSRTRFTTFLDYVSNFLSLLARMSLVGSFVILLLMLILMYRKF
eukprot:scaffold3.g6662.t1